MKKNLCIAMMMAIPMLWGCSQEAKQAEAPTPATMPPVEQAMDTAKEATEAVAAQARKTTGAAEEKVEKQVAPVEEKVAATAAKLTITVESVAIDNKNGKVVLPHKKHAEAYGCPVCHGDKKPGPQKLGKDAAHALCQGCHKETKRGPTDCNQCHQKKAKSTEGC